MSDKEMEVEGEVEVERERKQRGLREAASRGVLADTRRWLEQLKPGELDERDEFWAMTALMFAAQGGHIKVMNELLQKGANPNVKTVLRGRTALMFSAMKGYEKVAELLLQNGAELNATSVVFGRTALMFAAQGGHAAVAEVLLRKGADPRITDTKGKTALDLAYNDAVRDVIDSHITRESFNNRATKEQQDGTADKSRGANTIPTLSQRESSLQNSLLSPPVVPSIDPSSPGNKPRKTHLNQICTAPSESVNVTEIDSRTFTGEIEEALMSGWKQWRRSKIMIVGEGRAGKTGLANSIIGKPFEDTVSTVGINDMILNVKYACRSHEGERVDEGVHWTECPQPMKELETAVAQEMSRKQRQYDTAVDVATNITSSKFVDTNKDDADISIDTTDNSKGIFNIDEVRPLTYLPLDVIDNEMVMKCLAQDVHISSDLVIALYDYGGQSVFNAIHHLFLTCNGVYAVTFNMQWLLSEGTALQESFECLDLWVDSIIVHTLNNATGRTAPVVFVGTHKDQFPDPADHEKVSRRIFERYSRSRVLWPMVIENSLEVGSSASAPMYFYPVDNTLSRSDPTIINLLLAMEKVMDESSFTNEMIPLAWLKTLDDMKGRDTSYLNLDDVYKIGEKYGVSTASTDSMLTFFNDRGILLWLNEEGLRDVVIVDAIKYFVNPSTIVICKHPENDKDHISHLMEVHRKCRKHSVLDWNDFVGNGILTEELLRAMWEDYANDYAVLLKLMLKFGLMVTLTQTSMYDDEVNRYLVPALLKTANPARDELSLLNEWDLVQSCLLVFTVDPSMSSNIAFLQKDLISNGFMPRGLFERIISKILLWCQTTSRYGKFYHNSTVVRRNMAILHFGSQRFRMVACPKINSIQVDIEGQHPLSVHNGLTECINSAISECFSALICCTVLFHVGSTGQEGTGPNYNPTVVLESFGGGIVHHEKAMQSKDLNDIIQQSFVVPIKHLLKAVEDGLPLMNAGRTLLSVDKILQLYGRWLHIPHPLEKYMAFISYRCEPAVDSHLVSLVYDMFSNFTVGDYHEAIEVFLDKKRLQAGRRFDFDFVKALSRSSLLIPVVSVGSLKKMSLMPDVTEVDNVLLEWVVALELVGKNDGSCNIGLKVIFPIALGNTVMHENKIQSENLFQSDTYRGLRHVIPHATLERAKTLLQDVHPGIKLSDGFMKQTVRGIVDSVMSYEGFSAWENLSKPFVENLVVQAVKVIQLNLAENLKSVPPAMRPAIRTPCISDVANPNLKRKLDTIPSLMDFLRNDKNISDANTNRNVLDTLLDDWGVYEDQDLLDLEATDLEEIIQFLRKVKKTQFAKLVENCRAACL